MLCQFHTDDINQKMDQHYGFDVLVLDIINTKDNTYQESKY